MGLGMLPWGWLCSCFVLALRCCPRGLPLFYCLSLALHPGALLADEPGEALSDVLSRPGMHGGVFGMDGRVFFFATFFLLPVMQALDGPAFEGDKGHSGRPPDAQRCS